MGKTESQSFTKIGFFSKLFEMIAKTKARTMGIVTGGNGLWNRRGSPRRPARPKQIHLEKTKPPFSWFGLSKCRGFFLSAQPQANRVNAEMMPPL
jgi:hypothetical protein